MSTTYAFAHNATTGNTLLNSVGVSSTLALAINGTTALGIASTGAATFTQTGGSFLIDTNGHYISKQNLDVATAGGRFTGQSARGTMGIIQIDQVTTGADGGKIDFSVSPSGSTTPLLALTLASTGAATFSSLGTGTVTATGGTLSTVSDSSFKTDDGFIDSALEKVLSLKPRYFYWNEKSGLPMDVRQLGFYAQEVNEALGEEAANTPANKDTPWGITDRSMIAMLTKAVQELKTEIDSLKNQIK